MTGASLCSAAGPEAAGGEPDDVGVERDLDGGVAGLVVCHAWADGKDTVQGPDL